MKRYWIIGALICFVLIGLYNGNRSDEEARLECNVFNHREGELVFSFSIDDFINSYNQAYQKDKKRTFLTPSIQWQKNEYDSAIHSDYETICYEFSPDATVWSYPTMTVYVPSDGDYVQEITINFDDHSYSEQMYSFYEKMCFYTLKVLFPDLKKRQVENLYQTLNQLAYDNIRETWYAKDPIPCALYYKDGIGLYPYFAIGQRVRLCVIPVNRERIDEFSEKGVSIHRIE